MNTYVEAALKAAGDMLYWMGLATAPPPCENSPPTSTPTERWPDASGNASQRTLAEETSPEETTAKILKVFERCGAMPGRSDLWQYVTGDEPNLFRYYGIYLKKDHAGPISSLDGPNVLRYYAPKEAPLFPFGYKQNPRIELGYALHNLSPWHLEQEIRDDLQAISMALPPRLLHTQRITYPVNAQLQQLQAFAWPLLNNGNKPSAESLQQLTAQIVSYNQFDVEFHVESDTTTFDFEQKELLPAQLEQCSAQSIFTVKGVVRLCQPYTTEFTEENKELGESQKQRRKLKIWLAIPVIFDTFAFRLAIDDQNVMPPYGWMNKKYFDCITYMIDHDPQVKEHQRGVCTTCSINPDEIWAMRCRPIVEKVLLEEVKLIARFIWSTRQFLHYA